MKQTILYLLMIALSWSGETEAAVIRLRSAVSISSGVIRLSDIAEITEASQEERTQLGQLTIGPAPAAGKNTRVTLDMVRRELALRGVDQTGLQFTGGSESMVTRPEVVVPSTPEIKIQNHQVQQFDQHMKSLVQQYVQAQSPELQRLQIQFQTQELEGCLTQAPQATGWQIQGGQIPWIGQQRFTVTARQSDGKTYQSVLSCQISQRPRVLGLQQGLPRGQVIRETDLIWLDADVAEGYLSDPHQVIGTETVRSIRAQTPLQRDDIRQLPLVRRNDVVSVTVQIGAIQVRRYCRSLDEGSLGQTIVLTPVDGKEKITARVSGFREAQIALPVTDLTSPPESSKPSGLTFTPTGTSGPVTTGNVLPVASQQELPASVSQTPAAQNPNTTRFTGQILSNRPARLPQ